MQGRYANLAVISHSPNDFVMDMIFVAPNTPKARVQSRIIMTPENAKQLLYAMKENIDKYEANFGEIRPRQVKNNDGIMDFIFPGAKLYTAIYNRTAKQFNITTLYQNVAVDDIVYCYDFDHDGDLDLLATFTAAKNSTGYAYTCFFTNNGQGVFTQQEEQDHGENNLWFSALQDIDGDGNYDLLALRGDIVFRNTTLGCFSFSFDINI